MKSKPNSGVINSATFKVAPDDKSYCNSISPVVVIVSDKSLYGSTFWSIE